MEKEPYKRICFVGNCQTSFLSRLVKHHKWNLEQIDLPEAYLAQDDDRDFFIEAYNRSDYIVTRLMNKKIPEYVTTKWLKRNFSAKIIVIPNLYFKGFDPDLTRIYDPRGNTVVGPLGDYSCNMIHFSYIEKWTVDQCINLIKTNDILDWYPDSARKSIEAQKKREELCDIKMLDFFEHNMFDKRLFYTFNHPTNELLLEMFVRLMNFLQIQPGQKWVFDPNFLSSNSLSHVISPIHPAIQRHYKIKFNSPGYEYKTDFDNNGLDLNIDSMPRFCSIEELVPIFYRIYDERGLRS